MRKVLFRASLQKAAQLDLDQHQALMDNCMLYLWLRPKLEAALSGEMMGHLDDMFLRGRLGEIEIRHKWMVRFAAENPSQMEEPFCTSKPVTPWT